MAKDGMEVARDWAEWFLGDPRWATEIIWAYTHPEQAREALECDKENA